MRDMPLPSESFAAALSVAAIDHLRRDDITKALREFVRVLAPGGHFLFSP